MSRKTKLLFTLVALIFAVAIVYRPRSWHRFREPETISTQTLDLLADKVVEWESEKLPRVLTQVEQNIIKNCHTAKAPYPEDKIALLARTFSSRIRGLIDTRMVEHESEFAAQGDAASLQVARMIKEDTTGTWKAAFKLFAKSAIAPDVVYVRCLNSPREFIPQIDGLSRQATRDSDREIVAEIGSSIVEITIPMKCVCIKVPGKTVTQLVGFLFMWSAKENEWQVMESVKYAKDEDCVTVAIPIWR